VQAVLFLLLAIVAGSLFLFDRADRVYWWLDCVFLLSAIEMANLCLFALDTDRKRDGSGVNGGLFIPLILAGWTMVWWTWFRLRRPAS
jgi:hypothetical protein